MFGPPCLHQTACTKWPSSTLGWPHVLLSQKEQNMASTCAPFMLHRMIHGVAPVPHTPPPPLPPSSEPTPSLRRNEVVPPWVAAGAAAQVPSQQTAASAAARPLSGGTLHPVLGAASNHAVGYLEEWEGIGAAVAAGLRRTHARPPTLQQQQQQHLGMAAGQLQGVLPALHPLHPQVLVQGSAFSCGKRRGRQGRGKAGGTPAEFAGQAAEEDEQEEKEGDPEDWQWWQNLRFTLCMLRRGLSRDALARSVAAASGCCRARGASEAYHGLYSLFPRSNSECLACCS